MSFTVICDKCGEKVKLQHNQDTRKLPIVVNGESEAYYHASAYFNCIKCQNHAEVWRTLP
jgi:hypothetical protein